MGLYMNDEEDYDIYIVFVNENNVPFYIKSVRTSTCKSSRFKMNAWMIMSL